MFSLELFSFFGSNKVIEINWLLEVLIFSSEDCCEIEGREWARFSTSLDSRTILSRWTSNYLQKRLWFSKHSRIEKHFTSFEHKTLWKKRMYLIGILLLDDFSGAEEAESMVFLSGTSDVWLRQSLIAHKTAHATSEKKLLSSISRQFKFSVCLKERKIDKIDHADLNDDSASAGVDWDSDGAASAAEVSAEGVVWGVECFFSTSTDSSTTSSRGALGATVLEWRIFVSLFITLTFVCNSLIWHGVVLIVNGLLFLYCCISSHRGNNLYRHECSNAFAGKNRLVTEVEYLVWSSQHTSWTVRNRLRRLLWDFPLWTPMADCLWVRGNYSVRDSRWSALDTG